MDARREGGRAPPAARPRATTSDRLLSRRGGRGRECPTTARPETTREQPGAAEGTGYVSLADEESVKRILSTSVMGLWEVVNNLTRLRPSRRERYRVAIFGSARAKPGSWIYEEVKRV